MQGGSGGSPERGTIGKSLVNLTLGAYAIGSFAETGPVLKHEPKRGTTDEEVSNRRRPCDSARLRRLSICGAGSGRVRPGQHGLRQGDVHQEDQDVAPGEELPD